MNLPEIKGFIDISLVDWDDRVSAVIFLPNCNFRCPFCYNTTLVANPKEMQTIPYKEIEQYFLKNEKWLDGVVITGGEPTLHDELPGLCKRIKELRLTVKLDTNGTNSAMVQKLIAQELVDYIALDIKAPLTHEKYVHAVGVNVEKLLDEVRQTIKALLQGPVDYEFRTTYVPTIHSSNDLQQICSKIRGCKKYVLQNFKNDVETLDPTFKSINPFSQKEMKELVNLARKFIPNTRLR